MPGEPATPPAPAVAELGQPGSAWPAKPAPDAGKDARAAAVSLGRQVRAWRDAQGLTQTQVAERLDWDQPQVARLERGAVYPNLITLTLLCERLNVQVWLRPTAAGVRLVLEPALAGASASSLDGG